MEKSAADGQTVNIPSLLKNSMERRRLVYWACYWICVAGMRELPSVGKIYHLGDENSVKQAAKKNFREYF